MNDELKIEYLPVGSLKPYEKNAKKHPSEQIEHIANSIMEFGFRQPLVIDKDNVLVIGHGRLLAAKKLGLDTVPCVRADDLTDEQIKALRLADNKTNESEWDFDLLGEELDGIFDIDMLEFGFSALEDKKEKAEKPEVEFSEILGEENNYIILKFDQDVDWLQVESLFELKHVRAYSSRKDGKITKSMQRVGVGRVVNGAQFLNKIGVDL